MLYIGLMLPLPFAPIPPPARWWWCSVPVFAETMNYLRKSLQQLMNVIRRSPAAKLGKSSGGKIIDPLRG